MANLCWNTIEISGDTGKLRKFIDKGKLKNGFWDVVPYLKTGKVAEDMGVEWMRSNVGCRWVGEIHLSEFTWLNDNKVMLAFESPWSPPTEWFGHVVAMFPDLVFTMLYEEGGNDLFGGLMGVGGEVHDMEVEVGYVCDFDDEMYEYDDLKGVYYNKETAAEIHENDWSGYKTLDLRD